MAEPSETEPPESEASEIKPSGGNWRHRLIVITATITLAALFLVVLPLAIRLGAVAWLESQGVERPSIEDVDLNLFTAEFVLKRLSAGEGLNIDRLIINIDWLPLLKKIVYIRTFKLEGSNLHLSQNSNGAWQVAEIRLPASQAEPAEQPGQQSPASPWLVVVDDLHINEFLLQVKSSDFVLELPLQTLQLSLSGLENSEQKVAKRLEIGKTIFSGFGYKVRNNAFRITGNMYFSVTAEDILASINSKDLTVELEGLELLNSERMPLAWIDSIKLDEVALSGIEKHQVKLLSASNVLVQPTLSGSGSFQMNRLDISNLDTSLSGSASLSGLKLNQLTAAGVAGDMDVLRIDQVDMGALQADTSGKARLESLGLSQLVAAGFEGGGDRLTIERLDLNDLQADESGAIQLEALKLSGLAGGKDSLAIDAIDLHGLQAKKGGSLQLAGMKMTSFAAAGLAGGDETMRFKQLNAASFSLAADKSLGLDRLAIQEFNMRQRGDSQLLTAIKAIELDRFAMGDDGKGSFDELTLKQISLPAAGRRSLGSIGAMSATGARIDAAGVYRLRRLAFNRLKTSIIKQKDGKTAVFDAIAAEPKKAASKAPARAKAGRASAKAGKQPMVIIDRLSVGQGSEMLYRDETLTPVLENRLRVRRFRLAPLDTSGRRDGKLDMQLQINKAGSLSIKGTVKPADNLVTDLKVEVKNVDMIGFSGFIESDFGKTIRTGQLNLDSEIKIADNRIDSQNDLLIRKLQLADSRQPGAAEKSVGMPIDMALDMMRDDRGDIQMDVPVKGDLDDPDVGLNAIINKALMIAMRAGAMTYATYALQPYGSIMMAADLASGMMKEASRPKLTPVSFSDKEALLSADMEDYVSKIAGLLKTKDFRLEICGVATRAEGEPTLLPEQSEGKKAPPPPPPLTDEQLLQLAQTRADAVMEKLGAQGIEAERLFPCKSAIEDQKESAPRVDLLLD